ncbi:hypothetical protein CAK78_08725, partial [Aeromonas sp. A35_P]|uniref:Ig-like domain-containing protein n=1 Tax=Aeromonas sp. A35_P TaxID=1983805 RepID=UPI000BC910C0
DGSWSYDPTQDPANAALAAGVPNAVTINYTVTDEHGATATNTLTITVTGINSAPTAIDAAISVNEDSAFTGTLPQAQDADGDAVSYLISGAPSHGTLTIIDAATGQYAYTPTANFAGDDSFQYTVVDSHGASNTYTISVKVLPAPIEPTITITAIADDNVLNVAESQSTAVSISGTVGGDAKVGDAILVTVNGVNYPTTVGAGLIWAVSVPGTELVAHGGAPIGAMVTSVDSAGNAVNANALQGYTIDMAIPTPQIQITSIADDNIVNAAEAAGSVSIVGTTSGTKAGDVVTATVNGIGYDYQLSSDNGNFSITVTGAAMLDDFASSGGLSGVIEATVSSVSAVGNVGTGSTAGSYTVDVLPPSPVITLNDVTADNTINSTEAGQDVYISGSVTEVSIGDTVTLSVNGKPYTGTVVAGNTFSIAVPGSELLNAYTSGAPNIGVSVSASDAAGNSVTVSATKSYGVDITPPAPTLTIDVITADNIINVQESTRTDLTITGKAGGDAKVGDVVTLTIGGNVYYATVLPDMTWSTGPVVQGADLIADAVSGDAIVSASLSTTDVAGNTGNVVAERPFVADVVPPVLSVTIDPITGDNLITSTEAASASITVTGKVVGEFKAGDTVTLELSDGTTTVTASGTVDAAGNWAIAIAPSSAFLSDADLKLVVTATTVDSSGNVGTTYAAQAYAVDVVAPTIINLDITSVPTHGLDGQTYYVAGDTVTVAVRFDDAVLVNGNPTLNLLVGDNGSPVTVTANYLSGSGSNTLVFSWTVQQGLMDMDNISVSANGITLPMGATITDINGNHAVLSHDGWVDERTQKIDAVAPTGTLQWRSTGDLTDYIKDINGEIGADDPSRHETANEKAYEAATGQEIGIYKVGDALYLSLSFDEGVTIDVSGGAPRVALSLNPNDYPTNIFPTQVFAEYDTTLSNPGAGLLVFKYVVTAGVLDYITTQGAQVQAGALTLNGAIIKDYAGNIFDPNAVNSLAEDKFQYIDGVAPDHVLTPTHFDDDVGFIQGSNPSGSITDDTSPTIHGTLDKAMEAYSSLLVYRDGLLIGVATVDGSNPLAWSYTDTSGTLVDGKTYSYTFAIEDMAGNIGPLSAPLTLTIDQSAPALDATITHAVDNYDVVVDPLHGQGYSGDVGSGGHTNDTSPELVGELSTALQAGEKLFVYRYINGQPEPGADAFIGEATVSGSTWRYQDTGLIGSPNTTYNYVLRRMDAIGNFSAVSAAVFILVLDTVNPVFATTMAVSTDTGATASGNTLQGSENADLITRDTSFTLSGNLAATVPAGETFQLSLDNGATWQTVTLSGTAWSYSIADDAGLSGTITVQFRMTDQASNYTYADSQVVVDLSAPNAISKAPILVSTDDTGVIGDNRTTATNITFTGNGGEAGAGIALVHDVNGDGVYQAGIDRLLMTGSVASDGSWSLAYNGFAANNAYHLGTIQWDTAGNLSNLSKTNEIFISARDMIKVRELVSSISAVGQGEDATDLIGSSMAISENGGYQFQFSHTVISTTSIGSTPVNSKLIPGAIPEGIAGQKAYYLGNSVLVDALRDGKSDLFVAQYGDNPIRGWFSDASGASLKLLDFNPPGGRASDGSIVAWDRMGDGYADIVYGDDWTGMNATLQVLENSAGIWSANTNYFGISQLSGVKVGPQVSVVDLNNDGYVDLTFSSNLNASLYPQDFYSLLNNAGGVMTFNQKVTGITHGTNGEGGRYLDNADLLWADFNGDGYVDLMTGRTAYYGMTNVVDKFNNKIYFNDGTGKISSTPSFNMTDTLDGP